MSHTRHLCIIKCSIEKNWYPYYKNYTDDYNSSSKNSIFGRLNSFCSFLLNIKPFFIYLSYGLWDEHVCIGFFSIAIISYHFITVYKTCLLIFLETHWYLINKFLIKFIIINLVNYFISIIVYLYTLDDCQKLNKLDKCMNTLICKVVT